MSKDEIYKEIVRYQYISFDMYDTLVKRDLKDPKDIFKLIEKAALKKYKNIVQGYSQLRVETEEKIRKSKKTEVTLTEIYNELAKLYTPYDIHHNQKSHKEETLINQVFETIFMADHGSAKRYIEQEGKYSVELLEPDLNDTESINWLNEYQKGALAFVEDYCENGISYDLPIEFITNCAFKQFLRPCLQDAKKWGSFKFRDGEISFIAYAHNLKYYLKNPHQFLKDYKVALWRIGFLKQVFKVNLPYDKIVSLQKHI